MGTVAVIGEGVRIGGFALAGALVLPADSDDEARSRWSTLPSGVDLVILTEKAAQAVGDGATGPLRVVMPQ